jgi:hypothetical protein
VTTKDLTTGPHLATVVERLKYAASKAGSIGLGEYTRVHKKDLSILIEAFDNKIATLNTSDLPLARELTEKLDRVKYFLTPETATKEQLQEAVDLATNVLAVGAARGVKADIY